MNDREIGDFLTIVKYMSLTAAARELYVTQPTLSKELAKMEAELGVRLFEREGNKLSLTGAGHALLGHFETLQRDFESLTKAAASLQAVQAAPIVVGFAMPFYVYAQTRMRSFSARQDGLTFSSVSVSRDTLKEMLLSGAVDLAISYGPISSPKTACKEIFREEIVVMASPNHPLAARAVDGKVTATDLSRYRVAALRPDEPFRVATDPILAACGVDASSFEPHDYEEYARLQREMADDFLSVASEYGAHIYPDGCVRLHLAGRRPYLLTHLSWLPEGKVARDCPDLIEQVGFQYRGLYGESSYDLLEKVALTKG